MPAYQIEFSTDLNLIGVATEQVDENPLLRFRRHFEQVLAKGVEKANAAVLATADDHGRPSARVVLIKKLSQSGFVFYTDYQSHKGRDLSQNPVAEVVFYWPAIDTQIRINGAVSKINREASERYFHSRPRSSQLGASVSPQSQIIESRDVLEQKLNELNTQTKDKIIPLPAHWGGYCLQPQRFEFWHNQAGRLHDRFQFEFKSGAWLKHCLAP